MTCERCCTCLSYRNELNDCQWGYKKIPSYLLDRLNKVTNLQVGSIDQSIIIIYI